MLTSRNDTAITTAITKEPHFALKSRLYLNAIKAAFLELNRMQPDGIPSIAKTVHVT
ncbi:MAG: hypothetical protein HQM12_19805 [SAR324 cluster bacterium]|nr:hypothetical protein [SAR324 cluster bacterium]